MHDKKQHDWVKFKGGALGGDAPWEIVEHPALGNPVGHKCNDRERCRNRCAFEVFRLAAFILGQHCYGYVEPS